jgi:hypothetical protein
MLDQVYYNRLKIDATGPREVYKQDSRTNFELNLAKLEMLLIRRLFSLSTIGVIYVSRKCIIILRGWKRAGYHSEYNSDMYSAGT